MVEGQQRPPRGLGSAGGWSPPDLTADENVINEDATWTGFI